METRLSQGEVRAGNAVHQSTQWAWSNRYPKDRNRK